MKYFIARFNFSGRKHRKQEIATIADQTFDQFDDATLTVFEELKVKLDVIKTKSIYLKN